MDAIERDRLRIAFVTYGAMNRKDWRTVSIEDVNFNVAELLRLLMPTLHNQTKKEHGLPANYGMQLVKECRDGLSAVLPFSDTENKFLDLLLERGLIDAALLTSDKVLQKRIQQQPLLQWKAFNVRKYKGLDG